MKECLGHVKRQRGLEIASSILTECTCNQCSAPEPFERNLSFQGISKPTGEWYVRTDSIDQERLLITACIVDKQSVQEKCHKGLEQKHTVPL